LARIGSRFFVFLFLVHVIDVLLGLEGMMYPRCKSFRPCSTHDLFFRLPDLCALNTELDVYSPRMTRRYNGRGNAMA